MDHTDARRARRERRAAPEPTEVERLEAEYGDRWEIYREGGPAPGHGPWTARRVRPTGNGRDTITAPDVGSLAERLAAES